MDDENLIVVKSYNIQRYHLIYFSIFLYFVVIVQLDITWRNIAICKTTEFWPQLTFTETITALFKTDFKVDFPFDPQELFVFALIGWVCACRYPNSADSVSMCLIRRWSIEVCTMLSLARDLLSQCCTSHRTVSCLLIDAIALVPFNA